MKVFFIALFLCLLFGGSSSAKTWVGYASDSVFIARLLQNVRSEKPKNLQLYFARQFLGKPYVAHTLEVGDDHAVVVNTRQLDCTTLVENVAALTICGRSGRYTFNDFVSVLKRLRYRDGKMTGYVSRLHYFSDWIIDKSRMGLVTERQSPIPPFSALQTIRVGYMSSHPNSYKALKAHPRWVAEISKSERKLNGKRFRYIPKAKVLNTALLRSSIKDGDIIAITCNKKGLDIAHLGFAVWRKDGLHLLNASMLHHKVVEEPMTLYRYLQKHRSHTGIRIISINK